MKNNNTHPCNQEQNHIHNSQEHVIKQWVDECTGKFIDPITVTDAVITNHGKVLTEVLEMIFDNLRQNKDLLNRLKLKVEDLENYKSQFIALKAAFDLIKAQIDNGTFATKTDLECLRTQLYAMLESIRQQLRTNTELFNRLLTYLVSNSGQGGQGGSIDPGDLSNYLTEAQADARYVLKDTLTLTIAIRSLNKFVETVKSDLTGEIFIPETNPYSEIFNQITLPPTVGGAFYVDDTANGHSRFHFTLSGDVNGDGNVTAADITALYGWLLNNDDSQVVFGDQTGDNTITAADITAVYNVLLNGRQGSIHDKVTEKDFNLPAGVIFMSGNYIYYVANDNSTVCIGRVPRENDYLASTYNVIFNPSIPAEQIVRPSMENNEKTVVTREMEKAVSGNKLVNVYIAAAKAKNLTGTMDEKIASIDSAIANNTFTHELLNYSNQAYKEQWTGLPQEYAQGLVFMVDSWNDSGIARELQRVQPLGSFIDFKRFFATRPYIDIAMFGRERFNKSTSRFNVVDLSTIPDAPFSGQEDYIIVADYTPSSGVAYRFFWNGKTLGKPVIVEQEHFDDYLASISQ